MTEPPPAGFTPAPRFGAAPFPPVRVVSYAPAHVVLETETREPAVLVLSDTFDPRWRAWDNGQPVPIARGDHALRAVFLSAGPHRVEYRFRQPSVFVGLGITLATLGALGVAWIVASRRRRGGAERRAPSLQGGDLRDPVDARASARRPRTSPYPAGTPPSARRSTRTRPAARRDPPEAWPAPGVARCSNRCPHHRRGMQLVRGGGERRAGSRAAPRSRAAGTGTGSSTTNPPTRVSRKSRPRPRRAAPSEASRLVAGDDRRGVDRVRPRRRRWIDALGPTV